MRKKFLHFSIDSWKGTNDANENINRDSNCEAAVIRPFGVWYQAYFKGLTIEVVCFGSTFAVSRAHILQNSKPYYENLLSCLDKHYNLKEGHLIERFWAALFVPIPENV